MAPRSSNVFIISLAVICCTCQAMKLDMTYAFDSNTVYWPEEGRQHFEESLVHKGKVNTPDGGQVWYEVSNMKACMHGGTHIDAPYHFAELGDRVGDINIEDLIGPAVKIDISEKAESDKDYAMTKEDVLEHEKQHGTLPSGVIVFVHSGWGKFYSDVEKYMGKSPPLIDYNDLHFPGVDVEAARFLVEERGMKGLAVETASFDIGSSKTFPTHVYLASKGIWAIESAANVDQLPPVGATAYVAPMMIHTGSGAPTRIYALWDDATAAGDAATSNVALLCMLSMITVSLSCTRMLY